MKTFKGNHFLVLLLLGSVAMLGACSHRSIKPSDADAQANFNRQLELNMVHFAFDSSVLTAQAKEKLTQDAEALKNDPTAKVEVQGYCDERGSVQYNLSLGAKRARTVMAFLKNLGVEKSRITTVSYGKSNPLDPSVSEQAFAKNRRASFAVHQTGTTTASR